MTRNTLARALSARIDRLRETFTALDAAVREKVAEIAGKAVADAVRGAVRAALEAVGPPPPPEESHYDPWGDEADDPKPRHRPTWMPAPPPAVPTTHTGPRAAVAVLAGCRAAAWWLTCRPGWGWVAAGLAAATVAYACGPLAAAALPAAAAVALAARAAGLAALLPDPD